MQTLRLYIILLVITILLFSLGALPVRSDDSEAYSQHEQHTLLTIARDTLAQYLNQSTVPSLDRYPLTLNLKNTSAGVFVTLKEKRNHDLRGCIGYIIGKKPLAEAVIDCTIQAATRDRRFSPMKKEEDKTVYIEISVLTPPRKIKTIDEIQIGKHGLIISKGLQSGVLLPQVPVELGWDRDEFLEAICKKAGLPERSWEQGADLYVFSAQVFGEPHTNPLKKKTQ